jgi:HlyD family secretion protein
MNKQSKQEKKSNRSRAARKWFGRIVMALVAIAVVGAIVYAVLPQPEIVDVGVVERGNMSVTIDEDGQTRIQNPYLVTASLSGRMPRIMLEEGDTVTAGQTITTIHASLAPLVDERTQAERDARLAVAQSSYRQARAARSRAEAELEYARNELQKLRQLASENSVEEARVDRAELEVRTAEEQLNAARYGVRIASHEIEAARAAASIGDTDTSTGDDDASVSVVSPIDGVVLDVIREHRGPVQAGEALVEIGNPDALELVVDVLTTDAVQIDIGDPAQVVRWGQDVSLEAHVTDIEPRAFSQTSALGVEEQRVNVLLELDSPPEQWESLKDGYRVEAEIETWRGEDVLQVPTGSIFRRDESWAVYVVRDGVAKLQTIELGRRNGFHAQVLDGLEEGDEVILHPGEDIAEDVKVEVRE